MDILSWVLPIVWTGSRKELSLCDIHQVPPENASERLHDKLYHIWKEELRRKDKNPSLSRAIVRAFRWQFFVATLIIGLREWVFR